MRRSLATARTGLAISAVWLAAGWAVRRLRPLDERVGGVLPAWVRMPGALLTLVGAAGVLNVGIRLSRCGIGTLPEDEWFMPREFLASGPFRYVRNPMSLAGVVLAVGFALLRRSASALGLAALVFIGFNKIIIDVEEPGLEKRFGESYREYKQHVPRWLPRMRPWRGRGL